jgi:hypothetical protein
MADVVVTVPQGFTHECAPDLVGYAAWIAEGDAPGTPWSGREWAFPCGGWDPPTVEPGERVYVVCQGRLRGYAPLIRLDYGQHQRTGKMGYSLVRGGGAVAVTLRVHVVGFRGWRYRWWDATDEVMP